jgi:hypothetical protein
MSHLESFFRALSIYIYIYTVYIIYIYIGKLVDSSVDSLVHKRH